jgi:hypothetical protein
MNDLVTKQQLKAALAKTPRRLDAETRRLFAEALATHPDFASAFTPTLLEFDYVTQLGYKT